MSTGMVPPRPPRPFRRYTDAFAPHPHPIDTPVVPTSTAARDARLRRMIRDGKAHPKRPLPNVADPVEAATRSAAWSHVLAAYLWAWSADTWESWHAHGVKWHLTGFYYGDTPRETLTRAVDRFHDVRTAYLNISRDRIEYGGKPQGYVEGQLWWLIQGLHPSVRDVPWRVLARNRQRAEAPGSQEAHEAVEFLALLDTSPAPPTTATLQSIHVPLGAADSTTRE